MFETKPRRIASSAISRWLQWLIGRSLSDGFSQVIAITAQICSGVYVAGAPERGASASRSGTDWAGGACRHRPRQYRTVFGHTSSSRALSRTPTSSAACNIMRIRNANCCDVEWARSSASSASRCAGSTITGSAANRGIATSRLSFRLVMPHRRRFDSALCRKAASFRLPSYLHASRSRDFRSAVLVTSSGFASGFRRSSRPLFRQAVARPPGRRHPHTTGFERNCISRGASPARGRPDQLPYALSRADLNGLSTGEPQVIG
jgi:hypothetical protein